MRENRNHNIIYIFEQFDIIVDDRKEIGIYFIPKNFREVATKEEIHKAINICKMKYK